MTFVEAKLAEYRVSVDHGTALSLARSGKADAGSLRAAVALAIELAGPNAGHAAT